MPRSVKSEIIGLFTWPAAKLYQHIVKILGRTTAIRSQRCGNPSLMTIAEDLASFIARHFLI